MKLAFGMMAFFWLGLVGFGSYALVDDLVRHYGPLLTTWWRQ